MATLILIPDASRGVAGIGSLVSGATSRFSRVIAAAGVALGLVAALTIIEGDDFDDTPYPVAANEWLLDHDLSPASHRIVARELVGNWFEAVYGPTQTVFMDDRVEVMPASVIADHQALLKGDPDWEQILGRYEPDAVLWGVDTPLAAVLELSAGWRIEYRDRDWLVAVPASS